MKSIVILTIAILIYNLGISQNNQIAVTKGEKALIESKTSKVYSFIFPDNITAEMVEQKARSSTFYFTVKYNVKTHLAIIKLTQKVKITEAGMVMIRYLKSLGIESLKIDDEEINLPTFNKEYLRK